MPQNRTAMISRLVVFQDCNDSLKLNEKCFRNAPAGIVRVEGRSLTEFTCGRWMKPLPSSRSSSRTGTRRIITDCVKAGLPEPQFESGTDSFRVVFEKTHGIGGQADFTDLGESERKIMQQVLRNGRITREECESVLRLKKTSAKRYLGNLVSKGSLVKRGAARNTVYELGR